MSRNKNISSARSSQSARNSQFVEPDLQSEILSGDEGFTALSLEQERDLALRGQAGDRDALWALAMANHNFVRSVAQRYLRPELELEDLVAEGLLGLVEAAERFEPQRGVKFITYGSWWVKRALLRHLRGFEHPVHVPKYKQHQLHEFRRSRARLAQANGRMPSLDELSVATGKDIRSLEELAGLTSPAESLDASIEGGLAEQLRSSDDVEALVIQRDALLRLDAVMPVLTERERNILEQRFGLGGFEPVTLAEIGQRVGLTKERVRQIEKSACARLQEALATTPALRRGSKTPTVPAERVQGQSRHARVHAA